jgi:CheY-like chemotaxis protein
MFLKKPIKILLVDDDLSDRELFGLALNETEVPYQLIECENGKEAIDCLQNCDGALPDIIFLDLNMPVMDGREALAVIKKKWPQIITCMFSTSNSAHDIYSCYSKGANLFFVKPSDFNEIIRMQKNLFGLFSGTLVRAETSQVK